MERLSVEALVAAYYEPSGGIWVSSPIVKLSLAASKEATATKSDAN